MGKYRVHPPRLFVAVLRTGAGGMLGTTNGMTVWERVLYTGTLLPARQQAELLSLVSTRAGMPIDRTSPDGSGLLLPRLGRRHDHESQQPAR
jgi:hypothetical protein